LGAIDGSCLDEQLLFGFCFGSYFGWLLAIPKLDAEKGETDTNHKKKGTFIHRLPRLIARRIPKNKIKEKVLFLEERRIGVVSFALDKKTTERCND
jgi:hypothetical protein